MMDQKEKNKLYTDAWDLWGANTQLDMLIEEMAELTQAILKARREGKLFSENLIEEFADVTICMEQLELQFPPKSVLWSNIEYVKEYKLRRLKENVNDSVKEILQ